VTKGQKKPVETRLRMSIAATERWERERKAKGKRSPREVEHSLRAAASFHNEPI
jgi:hypothetical protein